MPRTTARRPGPLQDLPLELFLPPNPNLPAPQATPTSFRPNKRPLSPGGRNLFSPTKRRILTEEGIFCPIKTPVSNSRGRVALSARFSDISPRPRISTKKLDFSPSKELSECSSSGFLISNASSASNTVDTTPTRPTPNRLAPSPELISKRVPVPSSLAPISPSDGEQIDNYFSPQSFTYLSQQTRVPVMISRELPPQSDIQSVHYPGFQIYLDTHILAPHVSNPIPEGVLAEYDKDEKENLPPPTRARKAATAHCTSSAKVLLFSPESRKREIERSGKAKSTPVTPRKSMVLALTKGQGTLTPRRPIAGFDRIIGASPMMTPEMKEKERVESRRMLKCEVDEFEGEDEREYDDDDLMLG